MREHGYHLFSFDHRGHGESHNRKGYVPRQWVTEGEVADLVGALDVVLGLDDVDRQRVALLGVSRGAGTALVTAARRPEVRAVVLDSAFSTEETVRDWMRRWASIYLRSRRLGANVPILIYEFLLRVTVLLAEITEGERYPSVEEALRMCEGKALAFVAGLRDSYIDPRQSQRFHALHRGPADTLLLVDRAKHNQSVLTDPDGYERFVKGFLARSLGEQPTGAPA
jgi:pimeloyl-ACP methyl ester carboxylesterase